MPNFKNMAVNLLLLVFGLIVALIVLEIGLRVLEPFEFRIRGNEITLPSNVQYVTTNDFADKLDKIIIHSKNSLGFRGEEPPSELDKILSVIVVGGSTTESRFQSDDKEWVYLLGQNLNQYFSSLWINNAGLDGHSTFGHQMLMNDLISPIKPKVTLFLVGINDIGRDDLIINEKKFKNELQTDSPALLMISLANKSEVLTLTINMFRYLKAKKAGLTHEAQLDLPSALKRKFEISKSKRNSIIAEHESRYLPDYAKRIEKLVRSTQLAGSKPVFITQPVLYGPVIDDVTGVDLGQIPVTNDMDGALAWQILEMYNNVLRSTADTHNLLLIDLATTMPKSSALYYDTIHFTNKGAELVARNVSQRLCTWLAKQYPEYIIEKCPASDNK